MGTRSRVGVMHGTVCKSVYCHYDGYLKYTGEILNKHYDSALANQLVARGDNSGVKETLDGMNFDGDPSQDDVGYHIARTFEEFLEQVQGNGCEYYYVMRDGVWYAGCVYETKGLVKNGLVALKDAMTALEAVA